MQSSMQRLWSKVASKNLAQDALREVTSLAARPVGYPSFEMASLPTFKKPWTNVKWTDDWPDDASDTLVRTGLTDSGALLTQHFAVWEPERQKQTLKGIRKKILQEPTEKLNLKSEAGIRNTMLVLRFLHDLEQQLDAMNSGTETQEGEASENCDEWAGMEFFCRPWVIAADSNTELLRIEEFVDPLLRGFCGLLSAAGAPVLAVAAAWLQMHSPRAWMQLHSHRLFGPSWNPCKVQLDAGYRIDSGLSFKEMADACAKGLSVGMVKGDLPQLVKQH